MRGREGLEHDEDIQDESSDEDEDDAPSVADIAEAEIELRTAERRGDRFKAEMLRDSTQQQRISICVHMLCELKGTCFSGRTIVPAIEPRIFHMLRMA